jgi:hypothetical protein
MKGRVARVPRPSRSLQGAGIGNACARGLTTPCYSTNQIAQAASPPTLAKNARMGHPLRRFVQADVTVSLLESVTSELEARTL